MGRLPRDEERIAKVREALIREGVQALVCALPKNVLMLTGYWPVVGKSVAVVTQDGWIGVAAPEDERDLAEMAWADRLECYEPADLYEEKPLRDFLREPLGKLLREGQVSGRIGLEGRHESVPTPYASLHLFANSLWSLMGGIGGSMELTSADTLLERLCSVKTEGEIRRVETACEIARMAFEAGKPSVREGETEVAVAADFRRALQVDGVGYRGAQRADGFAFCMSGPNASRAFAAYQRSRDRRLRNGDLTLIHFNSYADGFWTDVTRTLPVGEVDDRAKRVLAAIADAREAALQCIRPGAKAAEVDAAARRVMEEAGFGKQFRHGLGHGVGFEAIDHAAHPRLSPGSFDVLAPGMVFNVEPGAYFPGELGARHCDMVAVTESGHRLLTPW